MFNPKSEVVIRSASGPGAVFRFNDGERFVRLAVACVLLLLPFGLARAAEPSVDELLNDARAAFEKGETEAALSLAAKAIAQEPKNPQGYYARGRFYSAKKEPQKAIADFSEVLKLNPRAAQVYHLRGAEYFKAAKFSESLADFDKSLQMLPADAPQDWQRGITCYYAGRYEEGRKQFELHQTVNPNDVENAVWHFLCVARSAGPEKARAALLPIRGDRRVPMMEIYGLFAGKGTEKTVMAAAQAGEASPEERKQRLFYAHLYLGLFYEATGNARLAQEHMIKAAGPYAVDHYMGDVARVHAQARKAAVPPTR